MFAMAIWVIKIIRFGVDLILNENFCYLKPMSEQIK